MDGLFRTQGIYRFGPFRLDPIARTLTRDEVPVPLQARLFDTLQYLIEHHDRVVEREELTRVVWRGRTVDANNLSQAISGLRRALRDGADGINETPWLATAQRGYRIALPVSFEPHEPPPAEKPRARWPWVAGGGLAAAALILGILVLMPRQRPQTSDAAAFAPPPHSVAVLAFANMTGDPGQAYLADGIAEELIDALSQANSLQVVARSSSFVFKTRDAGITDIARELNVSAVLEGSIRSGDGRLRIAARLVDGRTGFQLWAKSFDRAAGEALAVESDIGTAVAKVLHPNLAPAEVADLSLGGTNDAAAFDDYLRGVVADRAGPTAARKALASYDAAIAHDPNYARAFARRAIALAAVADFEAGDNAATLAETESEAIRSAERAVALAPNLGAAYAALGRVLLECRMDFRGAATALARAEELAPRDGDVLLPVAWQQGYLGHFDAAIAAAQQFATINPLSPSAHMTLAQAYIAKGAVQEALASLHRVQELDKVPDQYTFQVQASADFLVGNYDAIRQDVAADNVPWHQQLWLAVAEHALGHTDEANAALAKLRSLAGDSAAYQYAGIYASWGEPAEALHWLQQAYQLHDPGLLEIRADHLLDPIRSTPEYKKLELALDFPP